MSQFYKKLSLLFCLPIWVSCFLIPVRAVHAGGCGENGAGFVCAPPAGERDPATRQMRFRPDQQMTGWQQGWEGFSAGALEGLGNIAGLPGVNQILQGLGWVGHQVGRGYGAYLGGAGLGTLSPGEQLAADIGQGLFVEGAMTLGTAGLGRGASAVGSRARAFLTKGRPLPIAADPLMASTENIPKRAISNVDKFLGKKLGAGVEGTVHELAGDPTRVIKIYKANAQFALDKARKQISGLQKWKENIARAGLQDKMEVVETLEYGIDAQGRAYSIHPFVRGDLSVSTMNRTFVEELYNLRKTLAQFDPEMQRAAQMGISVDYVIRNFGKGNFIRIPAGKWIIIDPL